MAYGDLAVSTTTQAVEKLASESVLNTSPAVIAPLLAVASTGTLPASDGTVTIADADSPTSAELLKYAIELETKLDAVLTKLTALGITVAD